jgi:hypothetical protein
MPSPRLLGLPPSRGRPIRMTHPLLQLGCPLMQRLRRKVGCQFPLLDLEELLHSRGGGSLDRPHPTGSLLDPPRRPLNPTVGLLNTGPDPLHRLIGLPQQEVGRPDMVWGCPALADRAGGSVRLPA